MKTSVVFHIDLTRTVINIIEILMKVLRTKEPYKVSMTLQDLGGTYRLCSLTSAYEGCYVLEQAPTCVLRHLCYATGTRKGNLFL